MKKIKFFILKNYMSWHRCLAWTGGLALLIFGLSGILHPIMTWTGPQAVASSPPQAIIPSAAVARIPAMLQQAGITAAVTVKAVPAETGVLLQVTQHPDQPRRYFTFNTGLELPNYDQQHALWLARYYTGLQEAAVKEISFQTTFNDEYPWVNRLLPIYKIRFDTPDHLTAFIYTELGVLTLLTNDWKTTLQTIFQFMHTFNGLDTVEPVRIALMLLLLISLFGMAATGITILLCTRYRKKENPRSIHRSIAYVIWIPLLLFSVSGMYHLLHYTGNDHPKGLTLNHPMAVNPEQFGSAMKWLTPYHALTLNSLSIIEGPNGELLYRLAMPKGRHGEVVPSHARFDGLPLEQSARYVNTLTGEASDLTDREMALYYSEQHLGWPAPDLASVTLVTRFGPEYDFRNKRLPVWSIRYPTPEGDQVFIDPASGMLVDRLVSAQRLERYSFSFLHKWNVLTPLIGRTNRDLLMVLMIILAVIATVIGYALLMRGKNNRPRTAKQPKR